jgi:hypothetical protein
MRRILGQAHGAGKVLETVGPPAAPGAGGRLGQGAGPPAGAARNSRKPGSAAQNEVNDACSRQFKVSLPRSENSPADHVL